MSYTAASVMAGSNSLLQRITACVAQEGEEQPYVWAQTHMWKLVSRQDWIDAWAYAENHPNHRNMNQDTGARDDVIDDGMILSAVQAVRSA